VPLNREIEQFPSCGIAFTHQKKIELIKIGDASIGRIYLEPGWSWEKCVKPIAKTESCQATHRQYVMSGRVRVKMNDGSEEEYGPGDVTYIPPGHNAWVVGNEPYTAMDFGTVDIYAKNYVAAP
jgi:mannose-6-phosphate isomerase-like protein (cupin superfamily)